MFAVVFEVRPRKACWNTYLELAKHLKPKLEQTEGFIDNERFESRRTEGRVLSLSTWRDEKALVRWRTHAEHYQVQDKGRREVFEDYRLRVGEITSDSHEMNAVAGAYRSDATEVGCAKVLTLTQIVAAEGRAPVWRAEFLAMRLGLEPKASGLVDQEVFASLHTPGKLMLLASWTSADRASAFAPEAHRTLQSFRHRAVLVIRDYGLRDRREAPQYHRAIER
jgi:heme-degrading monooxygenase HmoA